MDEKEVRDLLKKKISVFLLALAGFLLTIKLAAIYYDSNFNPYALPSFCSVNDVIDCDGVAQTTHSQFFGIPLAYWGMCLYLFVMFMLVVDKLKNIKFLGFLEVFKNPMKYVSALGYIAFVISMILAGISIFEIKKVCILCFATYFIDLCIALIASDLKAGFLSGLFDTFKTSVIDFIDAIKIKKYLISFISLAILASAFLVYTSTSFCFTPQVKRYNAIKKYMNLKSNPFKATGNILGDANGKIIVYVYTDYRCPICCTYNVITHRAAQELSGFKMVHRNMPLDTDCNKYLQRQLHEGACMLAEYSVAAENQGKLWDLNSELFEQKPKDEDAVLKIAKSLGFDTIKLREDAHSDKTMAKIKKDIDSAVDFGIDGTPAIVINGKVYSGIKPYYELKDILIKVGAHERSGQ